MRLFSCHQKHDQGEVLCNYILTLYYHCICVFYPRKFKGGMGGGCHLAVMYGGELFYLQVILFSGYYPSHMDLIMQA